MIFQIGSFRDYLLVVLRLDVFFFLFAIKLPNSPILTLVRKLLTNYSPVSPAGLILISRKRKAIFWRKYVELLLEILI